MTPFLVRMLPQEGVRTRGWELLGSGATQVASFGADVLRPPFAGTKLKTGSSLVSEWTASLNRVANSDRSIGFSDSKPSGVPSGAFAVMSNRSSPIQEKVAAAIWKSFTSYAASIRNFAGTLRALNRPPGCANEIG